MSEDNAWAIKRADAGKTLTLTVDDLGIEQLQLYVEVLDLELFFPFILEEHEAAHEYAGKEHQQEKEPLGV